MAIDFPNSPSDGDTYGGYVYNGTKETWDSLITTELRVTTSATAPTSPYDGQVWYDTTDGRFFMYYEDTNSGQWVEFAGQSGENGATGADGAAGQDGEWTFHPFMVMGMG